MHGQTGDAGAARLGLGCAAVLGLAAAAMSDMQESGEAGAIGHLGVKAAFGASCRVSSLLSCCRAVQLHLQCPAMQPAALVLVL